MSYLADFQYGLEVRLLGYCLYFVIGDSHITVSEGIALMFEPVHDKSKILALNTCVIPPGFSQALCTGVATRYHPLTNIRNDLPCLTPPDWPSKTTAFLIVENEVVLITDDFRICRKLIFQGLSDTGVNHDFRTFASFLSVLFFGRE